MSEIKNDTGLVDKNFVEEKVLKIIEKHVPNKHKKEITLASDLSSDLHMDSLNMMELLMDLDEVMGTETEQEVAQKLKTVKSIIDYAWEKMKDQDKEKINFN